MIAERKKVATAAKGWLADDEGPFLRELALEARAGLAARFEGAPRLAPRRRLDETAAARKPVLRWSEKRLASTNEMVQRNISSDEHPEQKRRAVDTAAE